MHRFLALASRELPLVLLLVAAAASNVGCNCGAGGMVEPTADGSVLPPRDGGLICTAEETPCVTQCCSPGLVCGGDATCCDPASLCGDTCCSGGDACEGAVCHLDCGERTRCRDDGDNEVCCSDGEVCALERCFLPEIPCEDFWDCPEGYYCEPSLDFCLPQPTGEPVCQVSPSGGEVTPTELWHWDGTGANLPSYNQVMMTPVVANFNDDNGDGLVNALDIPDVVFSSFCGSRSGDCEGGDYHKDGVLRVVSGADGSHLIDLDRPEHRTIPGAQIAVGDIDGDTLVEIVACASDSSGLGPIIAFDNDGRFKWRSSDSRVKCGQSGPAIADLDADGIAEIIIRYTVLDGRNGNVKWHRACQNTGTFRVDGQVVTYEHYPCDYTAIVDLDGTDGGKLEIVGGNVAYDYQGNELWNNSGSYRDGYPAIGDLDGDGDAEIVVVGSAYDASYPPNYAVGDHQIRVLDHEGRVIRGPVDINVPTLNHTAPYLDHCGGTPPACDDTGTSVAGGGTPTIANFDDDPEPEIALAGAYGYVVFEGDLTPKWFAPTQDHSSRKTGSSVFDFDGDGIAEAVYNDEHWLRVYDGRDGTVRYCECNTSITHWEYPVIVDVNNDGHAEIIVSSNDYYWPGGCNGVYAPDACTQGRQAAGDVAGTHGVRVFAAPMRDWVSTRRIWNQHTYHITNVTESGLIPRGERQNWRLQGLNNFRQNVQPAARNIPDMTPIELAVDLGRCVEGELTLYFRIKNAGWSASPPGVPATVYVQDDGGTAFTRIARVTTTRWLLPGEAELVGVPFSLAGRSPTAPVTFRVVVNDGTDMPLDGLVECLLDNNTAETIGDCTILY